MKLVASLFLLFWGLVPLFAQQTLNTSIWHDGVQRSYILYVPQSYSATKPAPLVFNFHGYQSNAQQQMEYGDFRPVADTAGFLLVHPMGTNDNNGFPYWNADWGRPIDDVGFVDALIDSLAGDYAIDLDRIYSTGMSNGGYMSYTLLCNLSSRIAAIASVTGSMTIPQLTDSADCKPDRPIAVMQIHGTADTIVPYDGSDWSANIEDVLDHWIDHNQCDPAPEISIVPNVSPNDGSTAQLIEYKNGTDGVVVEFYKIFNGGHSWPGTTYPYADANQDFNASEKIWQFFSRYDIHGKIEGTTSIETPRARFSISPNPSRGLIHIQHQAQLRGDILVFNLMGEKVMILEPDASGLTQLSLEHLPSGLYFFFLFQADSRRSFIGKVVKQSSE